jgi:hypothetical protein
MNHFTLRISAPALALRALRPSFTSIRLPVRFVNAPLFQGLPYDSPLWQTRDVPVYVRQRRLNTQVLISVH